MSFRSGRGRGSPRGEDVYPEDGALQQRFFGDGEGSGRRNFKVLQLCRQVERASALALASECDSDVLAAASVVAVEPAPNAGRLRVIVALAPGSSATDLGEAVASLAAATGVFREEVARCIHRKRVPEIVFDVRRTEDLVHE